MVRCLLIAIVCACAWGCVPGAPGVPATPTGHPEPEETAPDPCEGIEDVPPTQLSRLTPIQYANSLVDLSEGAIAPPQLPAQISSYITELEVEAISQTSHDLVARGLHRAFIPCDPAAVDTASQDACAAGFIDAFGLRLFRRPVAPDERETLLGYYQRIGTDPDISPPPSFDERIAAVAEVMLASPQFLYVHDEGLPSDGPLRRTTGYERAAKLSLFLFDRAPDEALLALAAEGALDDDEGLRAEAEKMVLDPRARPVLRRFAAAWLGLEASGSSPSLEDRAKSAASFPFDSPELRWAMREEVESLYERVVADGDARFESLFTTADAKVTPALAELYGTGWANGWTTLDGRRRAGILTRAAFLAQFAGPEVTSPIRRGAHLYRNVLGLPLGDPPPGANLTPPRPGGEEILTTREAAEARTSNPACQACHGFFNPLGFAFEHYDAMGRWRDVELVPTADGDVVELPVSSRTEQRAPGLEGTDEDAVALSARIGQSAVAHDAHATRWFKTLVGRPIAAEDACTLKRIRSRFLDTGDLRALLVDVATSPPTRWVRPQPEEESP